MAEKRPLDRPPYDDVDTAEHPEYPSDEQVRHDVEHDALEDEHLAHADEESVVYASSPWDVARGWVRTLTLWVALALIVVETLLAFRLAFLLGDANPNNGFVDFIYDASAPLAEPFEGIASQSAVNGGVFDPATAIAMVVYLIGALLLVFLIWALTAAPSPVQEHRVATRTRWTSREDVHHPHH